MLTLEQSHKRAASTADSQQGDEPTALTWWLASFKASGLGIVGSGQRTDAGKRRKPWVRRKRRRPPEARVWLLRVMPEFRLWAGLTFWSVLAAPHWSVQMRKLFLVSAIFAGTALLSAAIPRPVLAWCYGSYAYACASPAERFAYSPWGYRSAYYPYYAGRGYRSWAWGARHRDRRRW